MEDRKPSEYWKRVTCIMMIRARYQNADIMTAVQCSVNTVKAVRRDMDSCNGDYEAVASRKGHSRRSDCVRTPEFIQQLQDKVMENPSKGIRALAREMGVGDATMKLDLNEDLRYHSYKRRKGQILTANAKENRLTKAKKLLNKLTHPVEPGMIWFFSDEKNFCQDQLHNTQNNRWLAYNPCDVPRIMKTKFPQIVMVFGCVSSEDDVMPPHNFEEGLRLNSDGYVKLLGNVVKPWLERVAAGRPYVCQRDSAPCHTSGKSQKWLSENFYDFTSPNFWPPNSPDCNPMDYYVSGAVEKDTNFSACNTKAELVAKIKEVFEDLPRDTVRNACARFQSRREAVVEAEGGYFE